MRLNNKLPLLLVLAASVAFAAEVYVSPTGNDANPGTIDSPLVSLTAARDKADKLKAGNTPVTVYLRGGTYYLSAPVEFGPSNSGTQTAPIVYSAYNGETPVISGGIRVTSSWTGYTGQIMMTTIAKGLKVDQLFLNGKRQVLARYPNYTPNQILDGYAADCISPTRVARWANPAEGPGYIRGLHVFMWGGNSYKITGKSGTTLTQQWVGDNNRGSGLNATYRMVENIFEELDTAGEWYYSNPTGKLYFYPPVGTDLSSARIELASQDELIRVVGASSANPTTYLTFKGLTFTHTYRTLFSQPYDSLLGGDWRIARAGTVFLENAENVSIVCCTFDQIGGNGVFVNGYNRSHVIFNNTFIDAGATCVSLTGLRSSVRCPSLAPEQKPIPCSDSTNPGPLTTDYPAYITVNNNMMYNFGRFEKQVAGVNISMSMQDTVRHNTICKMPRAGINFNDGCWGGHVVEYNWVYQSVLETGDHGPFNAWGRDRIARWPESDNASRLDAMYPTIVRYNRFESTPPFFGIDLDDQASNYQCTSNLLIGVGAKMQWNRYNIYRNNIIVNGGVVDIHAPWDHNHDQLAKNIFVGPAIYSLLDNSESPDSIRKSVDILDSNIIFCNGAQPGIVQWGNRGTSIFTWTQWLAGGLDAHSVLQDPMFTDTAKGDFSVMPGSPALAMGFVNFPMDSFGVRQVDCDGNPMAVREQIRSKTVVPSIISYVNGHLDVSQHGDYDLTIVTPAGRTIMVLKGKNNSIFLINRKVIGAGVYIAVVRTKSSLTSKRIMVTTTQLQ